MFEIFEMINCQEKKLHKNQTGTEIKIVAKTELSSYNFKTSVFYI